MKRLTILVTLSTLLLGGGCKRPTQPDTAPVSQAVRLAPDAGVPDEAPGDADAADEPCAASKACSERGECAAGPGGVGCQAQSDQQCAASKNCKTAGFCVLGSISPDPQGKGISRLFCLASDEGCARSDQCKERGACAAREDGRACHPTTAKHCDDSELCGKRGYCRLEEHPESNYCVPPCDAVRLRASGDSFPHCLRTEDQPPCRELEACTEFHYCEGIGDRRCRRVENDCKASSACWDEGRCNTGDVEECEAFLSEDCRASTGCKGEGKCHAYGGKCITDAEVAEVCGEGMVVEDGRCYYPPGYDCKLECDEENKCQPREYESRYVVCVETEEFCRNSVDCRQKGICGVGPKRFSWVNKCESRSDSDLACGDWWYGGCVKTVEDCPKSVDCKKRGNCSAKTGSRFCRPTRPEHCLESEICKREGQCKVLDESSYYICGD